MDNIKIIEMLNTTFSKIAFKETQEKDADGNILFPAEKCRVSANKWRKIIDKLEGFYEKYQGKAAGFRDLDLPKYEDFPDSGSVTDNLKIADEKLDKFAEQLKIPNIKPQEKEQIRELVKGVHAEISKLKETKMDLKDIQEYETDFIPILKEMNIRGLDIQKIQGMFDGFLDKLKEGWLVKFEKLKALGS